MPDNNTKTCHRAEYDVVIIGGGPVGSTAATLLKKYNPDLNVLVVEKEKFPRDHIGESQLPAVSVILNEMGCWDKVEAANFPIKIGASFTWGRNNEPWDLDFYPPEHFVDEPRPAKYEGQRKRTAFQVDRAIYDDILLRHTESMGVEVIEQVKVNEIIVENNRVNGCRLSNGQTVTARYYIDASGAPAVMRRALGIGTDAPKELRNIAIWDYWENAEWGVKIGVGATRVMVRSLPYGWIWFIPIGPTRTSIGLICPAEYYSSTGKTPTELYLESLESHEEINKLIQNANPTGNTQTCKDWSFVAHKLVGENWFLAGEAAGFADPILAAGLTLHQSSAREVAYTILELDRSEINADWLKMRYDEQTRTIIRQHIRFAQYWYSANGKFTDLKDHCSSIAKEAGLRLSPAQAWRWLAVGGFINHSAATPQFGSFDIVSAQRVIERFAGKDMPAAVEAHNVLKLNLFGAEKEKYGSLSEGRIHLNDCYVKGEKRLPYSPPYDNLINALNHTDDAVEIVNVLQRSIAGKLTPDGQNQFMQLHMQGLETMIHDGWVIAKHDKKRGTVSFNRAAELQIRDSAAGLKAMEEAKKARSQDSKE